MKFSEFLELLSDLQRAELETNWQNCHKMLTNAGGEKRQFVINWHNECMLCESCWQTLRAVIVGGVAEIRTLQQNLTQAFRRHTLQSELISPPVPAPLGRAVTEDTFKDVLRDQFAFSSLDEEEQFMLDLLDDSASVASNHAQLGDKFLSRPGRVMWATFDVDENDEITGANPFDKMPKDADIIRARLGLSTEDKGKDLLLFVYNLPAGAAARFPTIAEAYAGDNWLWYFRPALDKERWGRTMTWDACPFPPLPEVVHETITCDNLVEKIGIAKGH